MNRRLINIRELSEYLGVRVSTLYSWVSQGRITPVKLGRLDRFDIREIDEWIEESKRRWKKFEDEGPGRSY